MEARETSPAGCGRDGRWRRRELQEEVAMAENEGAKTNAWKVTTPLG